MKVLVLGIGNILFADEGIGVHLSNFLKINYSFSYQKEDTLDIVDGGTLANMLIPMIVEYDCVLILDCVSVENGEIGDVYSFSFEEIPNAITWAGSAHEVEMLQTLRLMEIMQDLPKIHIIGIIPEVIDEKTALNLSSPLKQGAKLMIKLALKHLENLGFSSKKIKDVDLQEIANKCCEISRGTFKG